ncbi:MAG: hypothetical protein M3P50_00410 [Actinomycetota bacterium]|nr:hypothetical protein [Actinomycetota bacterium]
MLEALLILASAEGAEEISKMPFYIAGGALTLFAVLVGALGVVRHDFPSSPGAARAVMGLAAVLVVATMATSVLTS